MPGEAEKPESIFERDPKQLEWAMRDLRDFADQPWSGTYAVLEGDAVIRTKRAAGLVLRAVDEGHFVPAPELKEAEEALSTAEEDNEHALERIAQVQLSIAAERSTWAERITAIKEQRDAYKAAYGKLHGAIKDAPGHLEGVVPFGDAPDPFGAIADDLQSALTEAEIIVSDFAG